MIRAFLEWGFHALTHVFPLVTLALLHLFYLKGMVKMMILRKARGSE